MAGPVVKLTKKKGFCFVEYINFRQAEKAANILKTKLIEGHVMKVQLATSKEHKVINCLFIIIIYYHCLFIYFQFFIIRLHHLHLLHHLLLLQMVIKENVFILVIFQEI